MPHRRSSFVLGALVILLAGCTTSADGASTALELDAGQTMAPPATVEEPPCEAPELELGCSLSYPPFLCEGRCSGGELCCVTGARPLGACRTLDGCADQCAYDCGILGQQEGPRAQAICEALCIAVPPDVTCE